MRFRFSILGAAVTTDEYETWFERGVTDGLPVVPPTRERVARMLAGTRRSAGDLLGETPPNYGRVTVDKAAINAVMAGCRPEYLPVLIAAAEAACDPAFNLHGVATSTHFSAPLVVVNGPARTRIGLNAGFGVFGLGYRANATIGRALRLLMINVGGARPDESRCRPSVTPAVTRTASRSTRRRVPGRRTMSRGATRWRVVR